MIPDVLVAGLNTIAVEIHQNSATSSDMTLDLMLIADTTQANQPPVANNQNAVAVQKTATPITLTGSDPDGNPLAFVITSSPTHGTLSGTPPNVTYTSAPAYVGADSFTFKVNDGSLDSADATISIQVVAPPDPPEVISAVGNCTTVVVTFNEPLDPINATEEVSNYAVLDSFGLGASIGSATLSPDQQAVTLVLDFPLSPATSYTLHILFVCDVSGDCARNQSVPVQFDTRPPIVVCATAIDNLWPANHELTDVGLTAVSSSGTFQVQVFSDEPDGGGDALFADGVLKLLSQREGKSDGRVYLIVVTSTDACGNVAACCTTIIAPHDSSQAALESVSGQAAAAQAQCSPTGAPLTPYRLLP